MICGWKSSRYNNVILYLHAVPYILLRADLDGNHMRLIVINRRAVLLCILTLLLISAFFCVILRDHRSPAVKMVMGGVLRIQNYDEGGKKLIRKSEDVETYFRPSDLPVLNDRDIFSAASFLDQYLQSGSDILLPEELTASPEETIVNYFSVLREAANVEEGKNAGCGTIGLSKTPYEVAYNFLSAEYREKFSYEQYLASFQNILHTSLLKYRKVPIYNNSGGRMRYFVELETIGGTGENIANFTYYYGFIDLYREKGGYKISNLEFTGEDFLCAPYHGWSYNAESSVQIRYGGWCKLIKELYPTIQEGYVKHIYFTGTDKKDYLIEFLQLTNDTDIEIAQYRKDKDGEWELIKLDPEDCLTKGEVKR